MIEESTWDSAFFQRQIGVFKIASHDLSDLNGRIKKAKKDGFAYITCKLKSQDTFLIKNLESSGFYLTDIGVIFAIEPDKFIYNHSTVRKSIQVATYQDIPLLKKMIKSLFPESRFYTDPFFSKEDGDRLYQAWIENSVKGEAADIVFHIPKTGFITCRKSGKHSGEIVLIGIWNNFRGKGLGTALVQKAMKWFKSQNIKSITVRTQLKNIKAIHFYLQLGFALKEYDIIFGKIL
jgi:GNAT superfamily N-acetyltransferase